ncbi:hypothetical protein PCAR4_570018 [Paraburkholderia caribensis]|nr:hypothetical protein PCAR4_570018 [Paraburkholderia caribensis]
MIRFVRARQLLLETRLHFAGDVSNDTSSYGQEMTGHLVPGICRLFLKSPHSSLYVQVRR